MQLCKPKTVKLHLSSDGLGSPNELFLIVFGAKPYQRKREKKKWKKVFPPILPISFVYITNSQKHLFVIQADWECTQMATNIHKLTPDWHFNFSEGEHRSRDKVADRILVVAY